MERFKQKLSDFKPEELIGKRVLWENGMTYDTSCREYLRTISKVTKTGFKISNNEGKEEQPLFSLDSGYQKGLNSRMDVGHHSQCHIITEEEEQDIKTKWRIDAVMKELKKFIKEQVDTLSENQLKAIKSIIETKS